MQTCKRLWNISTVWHQLPLKHIDTAAQSAHLKYIETHAHIPSACTRRRVENFNLKCINSCNSLPGFGRGLELGFKIWRFLARAWIWEQLKLPVTPHIHCLRSSSTDWQYDDYNVDRHSPLPKKEGGQTNAQFSDTPRPHVQDYLMWIFSSAAYLSGIFSRIKDSGHKAQMFIYWWQWWWWRWSHPYDYQPHHLRHLLIMLVLIMVMMMTMMMMAMIPSIWLSATPS